ncbi:hypothetical protein CDO73_23220 [Saccharibacillus sp. O23]|uniref:DUF2785 domain-containing protein n=1 Tax=Saccharibacillus sp. O23 TaxID=2009338 RepID=UPI000B4DF6F0|nr:DUF2785 domain-containing protein [Saccharibacillus sp. O23]OWR27165.1 hypothetical protein CDO73_23220 [Saccharibacillus sp. O23]
MNRHRSEPDAGSPQAEKPRQKLLRALRAIRDSGLPPTFDAIAGLTDTMLAHIGDIDSELRDEWIYGSFSEWIQAGAFEAQQLRHILNVALDEQHLFCRIGEKDTDSVFVRSFSMLLLPLLLSADRRTSWLREEEWRTIFSAVLRALEQERDLRGYVPEEGRGWAHAAAHAADALEDLGRSEHAGAIERLHMLEGVRRRLLSADRVFVHDEDDRLAAAAETILTQGEIGNEEWEAWLERFGEAPGPEAQPFAGEGRINARLFLQRLEIRLSAYAHEVSRAAQVRERASRLLM